MVAWYITELAFCAFCVTGSSEPPDLDSDEGTFRLVSLLKPRAAVGEKLTPRARRNEAACSQLSVK